MQFAAKMGANVTVLGHSSQKRHEALNLGATSYEILKQTDDFNKMNNHFDFILNTTAVTLNLDQYLKLLTVNGILCYVGLPSGRQQFSINEMFNKQETITVSNVGGITMTQEMLNFAADNKVKPMIEMIGINDVPIAYKRILNSDVHYRFVIDMNTLN